MGDTGAIMVSQPLVRLGPVVPRPDGSIAIGINGPPGVSCSVEGSTNLVTWDLVETLALTNSYSQAMDGSAAVTGLKMYRAFTSGP